MVFSTCHSSTDLKAFSWIIDSRSTSHICCSLDFFVRYTPTVNRFVTLPNNSRIQVHSIREVLISDTLVLHDVLYILIFRVNLISTSALLKHSHFRISFDPFGFVIQNLNSMKVIGKVNHVEGLYVLHSVHSPTPPFISIVNAVSSTIWHARLGHVSDRVLHRIIPSLSSHKLGSNDDSCDVGPLAKLRCLSFHCNNCLSIMPFDLVHCDI